MDVTNWRRIINGVYIFVAAFVVTQFVLILIGSIFPAKAQTPESDKPKIETIQRVGNDTFLLGDRVVTTTAQCLGWGSGATIKQVGDRVFLVFYRRKTRHVVGFSAGTRWVPTGSACEVKP